MENDITKNDAKEIRRKSDVHKAYPGFKEELIRVTLNEIIAKHRKVDLKIAKNQHKLFPAEVILFKNEMDPIYKSVG